MNVIFIMLDGFGIPAHGFYNSTYTRYCSIELAAFFEKFSVPIDACLDMDGIPQSATGQSALFCGINSARIMNSHRQGFPGPKLRKLIRSRNIFSTLIDMGLKVAFANAYVNYSLEQLKRIGFRSVTTIMTAHALAWVREKNDLLNGKAVYHDITRETIADASIDIITPAEAAQHLLNIATGYDFTLFEYFLSDLAGHKREEKMLERYLGNLNEFILYLKQHLDSSSLLIITADHGNCEDLSSKMHTINPVPLLVYGQKAVDTSKVVSIVNVHDFIQSLFGT